MTFASQTAAFVVVFLYVNVFEYALHRWFMHRPRPLGIAYDFHTLEHHRRFGGSDETFHLRHQEDRDFLFFRPWMVASILAAHLVVFAVVEWLTGWGVLVGGALAGLAYYGLYEYMHYSFHTRGHPWLERSGVWRALKRHHLLHHRYHDHNLNVLFPLTDALLGTRITDRPPRRGAPAREGPPASK